METKPSALLWIMFLAYFTFGMISNILGVIIPEAIQEYHLSLFAGGILAFAFFLSYGLFSIPTGLLMDRLGARPMILSGVSLMTVGYLGVSLARGYMVLLAMIFAIGVGVTALQTAGNPLIQFLDRMENYHRNLTLTIGFCGIGAFLGPFVYALFTGSGRRWESLYLFFAVLCLAVLIPLAWARFPSGAAQTSDRLRLDLAGKFLFNPLVFFYVLGVFFYVGAEVGTASWIVKFFERVHGLLPQVSRPQAGSIFRRVLPTLPALIVALFWGLQGTGRLVSGAVLNRFGSRRIHRLYAFMALASLLVATFGSTRVTAIGFAVCGFFTSVLITLIFSGMINSFAENRGTLSGLLCTACVGGALIPPLVGWIGDRAGMRVAMMVPALCFAYVFVLSIFGRARYE